MIEIGSSIGRYHIIEQLGEGGMATVYKAYDTRLERDVALKVIRIDAFPPAILERVLKRFEREALSLARLSHPNIVKVFDFGEHAGAPYLVMEFLPGGTLKQFTGRAMPWKKAGLLLIPVAQALDYAHQKGIIHRDVKPANILITEMGQPMLTDFGIAHLLEESSGATLTGTGVGIGTPEYMAPEQGMGRAIDGRADVYSLGIVYYELITGRKPFSADTPMAVVFKQLTDPLPPPGKFAPGLPSAVEKFLFKALAKLPEDRFDTMHSMAGALSALTQEPSAAPETLPETLPLPTPVEKSEADEDETGEETFDLGVTPLPAREPPVIIQEVPPRPSAGRRETPVQPEAVSEEPKEIDQQSVIIEVPPLEKSEKTHPAIGKVVQNKLSGWIIDRVRLFQPSIAWLKKIARNRLSWVGLGVVLIALIAIILTSAGASSRASNAYLSVKTTTLYLTSNRGGSRQVYHQDPSNGTLVRLSDPQQGECFTPAAVKDGLLYVTCIRNGRMGIYNWDSNREDFSPITRTDSDNCWEPAIGPYGYLYFTCDREGKREVYTLDSVSGIVKRITDLTQGESWNPALGPDGMLYFTSNRDGSTQVYMLSTETGLVTRVTDPAKGTCWSPRLSASNGLFLTCNRAGSTQIYFLNYETGKSILVTNSKAGENWGLVPGPYGYLYITSTRDGKREVYLMDSLSGVVTRAINTSGEWESWTAEN